jgi:hypothetical protein
VPLEPAIYALSLGVGRPRQAPGHSQFRTSTNKETLTSQYSLYLFFAHEGIVDTNTSLVSFHHRGCTYTQCVNPSPNGCPKEAPNITDLTISRLSRHPRSPSCLGSHLSFIMVTRTRRWPTHAASETNAEVTRVTRRL